jgi:hypothetical protein
LGEANANTAAQARGGTDHHHPHLTETLHG